MVKESLYYATKPVLFVPWHPRRLLEMFRRKQYCVSLSMRLLRTEEILLFRLYLLN